MHIRLLILSVLLGMSGAASCQKDKEKPAVETDLTRARFQINDIRDKGIIVRLRTDQDRIRTLRSQGYTGPAAELAHHDSLINMQLCYAFITRWSYAPVYFMESQHTAQLSRDSLVALTWDLQRDTVIHIHHDSIYLVDYGTAMENVHDQNGNTVPGSTPVAGSYIVTKGSNMQQLTEPLPYHAKVWGDRLISTEALPLINLPASLTDSIAQCLQKYSTIDTMIHSEYKNALARYMLAIYDHIYLPPAVSGKNAKAWGNSFTEAVGRYNEHFIDYYCKRLDKDKNIIHSDSPIYWWLRNPNIRYLQYLRDLEQRLKQSLDPGAKFTAPH